MAFALTITDSKGRRQHITDEDRLVVGAEPGCGLTLADPTVSRRHVCLHLEHGQPSIEDLGSTNGSWLNKQRLPSGEQTIWPQDTVLKLGDTLISWQAIDAGEVDPVIGLTRGPATEPAMTMPDSTLATGQFDSFYRLELTPLLDQARHASALVMGRNLGEALARATSPQALRIEELRRAPPAVLFELGELPDDHLLMERNGFAIGIDAGGEHPIELTDLLNCALSLLGLVADSEDTAEARKAATPPAPQSLEPAMLAIYEQAAQAARAKLNVVIHGATGAGKEVLARFIHQHSMSSDRPWVAVNCAALPESLLEAELFGIEKGVATGVEPRPGVFEQADQGLLFLDEIADMSLATQARILRVLEDQQVRRVGGTRSRPANIQIVAASNQDLSSLVSSGAFRRDLFHRLADWRVTLPELRDRPRDIPNLAAYFLAQAASAGNRNVRGLSRGCTTALIQHDWPGNVRELQREMQRAVAFAPDNAVITASDLADHVRSDADAGDTTLEAQLIRAERRILARAMSEHDGDIDQIANTLGVSRATLYRRLKAAGLSNRSQG